MSDITANVVVSMPSQLFTLSRSFKANANGKIYIGLVDTDPVNSANQIQVYLENEDGSHVPVAQPIIINAGGYPVYNGQIAKFVTVQNHSMAVYDAYGTQHFYYPDILKYDPDQFRQELAGDTGASLIGGSLYVIDFFADAISSDPGHSKAIMTRGHHVIGSGSSIYVRNGTTGTPSTGNEYKFFDSTGAGWTIRHEGSINCLQFGINGDGTNETLKSQRWIDSCAIANAKPYIPDGMYVSITGLVINSNHNGLDFDCDGWFKLFGDGSAPANIPSNTGSSAYFGIYINGASNITGTINVDGDRATKIYSEQVHCIGMYGGVDNHLTLNFKECRGDGIYVNHYFGNAAADPGTNTDVAKNFPTRLKLNVTSVNSDYDGRNAVSLIAYKGCEVSGFSYKHGNGKATSATSIGVQPGGLDVEPNMYWQSCYDLTVTSWISDCAGWSGGFSLVGKVNGVDPLDVNIKGVLANVEVTTTLSAAGDRFGLPIQYSRDINIRAISRYASYPPYSSGKYNGFMITCCSNFEVNIETQRAERVGEIAINDAINQSVVRSSCGNITVHATQCNSGITIGDISGVNVDFSINTPVQMSTPGDRGLVQYIKPFYNGAYQSGTVQNHNIKISTSGGASFLNALNFGVRVHPTNTPTVDRNTCRINESNLSNITHNPGTNQNRMLGTANFQKGVIQGVTVKGGDDAITGTNIWGAGDIIWNQDASATYAGKRYSGTIWQNFGQLS